MSHIAPLLEILTSKQNDSPSIIGQNWLFHLICTFFFFLPQFVEKKGKLSQNKKTIEKKLFIWSTEWKPSVYVTDLQKYERYYFNVFMSGDLTGLCLYILRHCNIGIITILKHTGLPIGNAKKHKQTTFQIYSKYKKVLDNAIIFLC